MKHLLGFLKLIYKKCFVLFEASEEEIFTGFTTFQATAVQLPYLLLSRQQTPDLVITLLADDSFVQELI